MNTIFAVEFVEINVPVSNYAVIYGVPISDSTHPRTRILGKWVGGQSVRDNYEQLGSLAQ